MNATRQRPTPKLDLPLIACVAWYLFVWATVAHALVALIGR